jgi:hypothetical protein
MGKIRKHCGKRRDNEKCKEDSDEGRKLIKMFRVIN